MQIAIYQNKYNPPMENYRGLCFLYFKKREMDYGEAGMTLIFR